MIAAFACMGMMGCGVTKEELRVTEARLRAQVAALEQQVGAHSEALQSGGKIQADLGADLVDLRDNLQKLRGATERLEVKVSVLESKSGEPQAELKGISKSLSNVSNRLTYLESSLGIPKAGEEKKPEPAEESVGSPQKGEPTSREAAYANAYNMFKNGQYSAARDEFRAFLKAFPDSEYSDNAQFWIGECNYFQGKYEEAIVEYESVIQNYPKGNKVPNALLKQALSFLKLGDTSSAKLLLQGVIKDYPNTTPASIARKRLIDLK